MFPPPAFVLDAIGDRLRRVHPGLGFQIGKLDDGLVLEISTDGSAVLIPSVRELCAAAPRIPGWSVRPFRQPIPAAAIRIGNRSLCASDLSFVMHDVVAGRAIIGVFVEGLAEAPGLTDAAFALLQGIAGELVCLTRIYEVLFADGSERPDEALPVSVLVDYLENLEESADSDGSREARDWMIADVELTSGKKLIVGSVLAFPKALFQRPSPIACHFAVRTLIAVTEADSRTARKFKARFRDGVLGSVPATRPPAARLVPVHA